MSFDFRPIKKEDYKILLELDKKVYPTKSPATVKTIEKWYSKNPEFGLIYEKDNKIAGICAAIPLNSKGFEKITLGKSMKEDSNEDFIFDEGDLDEKTIFDNSRDTEIAIHIYHIEKLDSSIKEFYKRSLEKLSHILKKLKKRNKNLKVTGFSGLCSSVEGINLFYNKLGCRERKYICPEHIIEKNGQKIIAKDNSLEDIKKRFKGYDHINRVKMLITYPSENSIIWKYLN